MCDAFAKYDFIKHISEDSICYLVSIIIIIGIEIVCQWHKIMQPNINFQFIIIKMILLTETKSADIQLAPIDIAIAIEDEYREQRRKKRLERKERQISKIETSVIVICLGRIAMSACSHVSFQPKMSTSNIVCIRNNNFVIVFHLKLSAYEKGPFILFFPFCFETFWRCQSHLQSSVAALLNNIHKIHKIVKIE